VTTPLGVAIIGCGNIARAYTQHIQTYPHVRLLGVTDMDSERARAFASEHRTHAYPTVAALLADPAVQIVVNLTTHHAHYAISTQALEAGKHVHSEKPLALTHAEAQQLVALAAARELRLSCSPVTLLGEAQQSAWQIIRAGELGSVRLAYAEVNWGRIESWHPAPGPFYEVGALFDVGVYPLTILTAIFGPARRVVGYGTVLYPDRVTREGVPFHIDTPDFVTAVVELSNGTVVRLTTNFYVGSHNKQVGIEFHGDAGSLHLTSWQNFDAQVQVAAYGQPYREVPLLKEPFKGTEWGRSVAELASAIIEERPHRATGEHAAHIVEVLCAIRQSLEEQRPIAVHSSFTPPQPLEWAL
jgi:predicted dehydrogenase